MYWILGNFTALSQSALTSIYLASLCKALDTKIFGFDKVFELLLTDLKTFKRDGLFVPSFGKIVKVSDACGCRQPRSTLCFTGSRVCRFCLRETLFVSNTRVNIITLLLLFSQIKEKFRIITAIHLERTYLSKLDYYTPNQKIFAKKKVVLLGPKSDPCSFHSTR